ncbi:Rv1535 domain-containing protein [Mycobacterium avium]|uniref:Rv1535 domain-containing protein n=1 Tax=Mycobacterium avium TaxID=1764 RepID=UPI00079FE1DD|nr:Rv1535 domain-containing protein [Mycobacterium avium]
MTAIRCDDVVTATRVPAARAARPPRPAPADSGNPLMDMTTRLLAIPLHQLYAVLWRGGDHRGQGLSGGRAAFPRRRDAMR